MNTDNTKLVEFNRLLTQVGLQIEEQFTSTPYAQSEMRIALDNLRDIFMTNAIPKHHA